MPAEYLEPAEFVAFKARVRECAARMGLKKATDVAPFVDLFVRGRLAGCLSQNRLSKIRATRALRYLEFFESLPKQALPVPQETQSVMQRAVFLVMTKPNTNPAWFRCLEDFVARALLPLPVQHSFAWLDLTSSRPRMEWIASWPSGAARVVLQMDTDTLTSSVSFSTKEFEVWLPAVLGSWCHETWIRGLEYLWRTIRAKPVEKPCDVFPEPPEVRTVKPQGVKE